MKKSKFLKNPKELLSRSFNSSKCKTALRLAGSRLKLLRNRKEVQIKQMRREIAQLIESGQDRTARIRVEHVIREEKMMAAYDLIEIYCELIVARLAIIESQKICPTDLKEAVASVIFASPRCGDVPELVDIRKHFTEKYGKEFTTAAVELRPECGVGRMLVEKLSAIAPDGQTKIKTLSAIAEEHNVKWDAKSFEEKDLVPPSDLLTGPATFLKESNLHVEPPAFKRPDVQLPQSITKMHALVDERAQLYQGESITTPRDRPRWNMEFKDATSAAQAAAESAELASIAARAAAELSNRDRILRQNSSESHKSDVHVLNDRGRETYMTSNLGSAQFSEEALNRSFSEHTRLQNEQIDRTKSNSMNTDRRFEDAHGGTREYSQLACWKSKASVHDDSFDHGVPVVDGYSRKNSLKEVSRGETNMQRQSFKNKAESAYDWQEKSENVREERIRKQPSVKSSRPNSSISNNVNKFSNPEDQKFQYDAGEDPFLGSGKAGIYREAAQMGSRESAGVVFDKYDSDNETRHGFDMNPTYDEQEPKSHVPLSRRKPQTDSWSPRSDSSKIVKSTTSPLFPTRKNSSSEYSENLRHLNGSKLDESTPVTFDESDGPTSESDEEMNMSMHTGVSRDFRKHSQSVGSQFKDKSRQSTLSEKGSSGFDNRKQLEPRPSRVGSNNIRNSSSKSEEGINFENLTGGLRHRGYNRPPYSKNQFDVSSSFTKEKEETTGMNISSEHKKSSRMSYIQSDSDSDSSEEDEPSRRTSDRNQKSYTLGARKEVKTKPSLAASNSTFGSDNSDLDEDLPEVPLSTTSHLRTAISRRTKAAESSSGKNVHYKMRLGSEALDIDDNMDRKLTSNFSEARKTSESQRNSSKLEKYDQPINSSSRGTLDQHNSRKTSSTTVQEPMITRNSSAMEKLSRPQPKIDSVANNANLKAGKPNQTSSNNDDNKQRASHVHPKLPDYDTFVQTFRRNRP